MHPELEIPPSPLLERIKEQGNLFLARFLEVETGRHPDNVDALAELGHVYTRLGRLEAGLEVDRRLVRLIPHNPTAHYNMACSLAPAAVLLQLVWKNMPKITCTKAIWV